MATEPDGIGQTEDKSKLTARQVKFLPVLLASPSYSQACKAGRVSRDTLYTWLAQPEFKAELDRQRNELVAQGLSPRQVKDLLSTASRYPIQRLRILIAVTTGLRRGDIEAIRIGDIHFDRNTITTQNRKAGKAMAERPIPEEIMKELVNHVSALTDGHESLFTDRFSPKKWKKICRLAGMSGLKFHDLRKTFASLLAQRGVSTAVTQKLLEHSSPQLTNDIYTNVDPVLRQAVSLLPVADWV
jgi:integrase